MPSQISLGTAIDIALKAQLKRDTLGCPEGVEFDARPEEVYQSLQKLAHAVQEMNWLNSECERISSDLQNLSYDVDGMKLAL